VGVEEGVNLALDARAQRGQEEADVDPDLDVVAGDRHLSGGAGPLEAERVTVPPVGSAVLVAQALGDALRQVSGSREAQIVGTCDDDLTHRMHRVEAW
jgi:hypothetical protein